MYKVIGEGSYGCVHRPSLTCKDKKIDYKNKISKLMTERHLNKEMDEYDRISAIDTNKDVYLGNPEMCAPALKHKNDIEECTDFEENKLKDYRLMIIPDGGNNLEIFAKDIANRKNTPKLREKMRKFWVECHRLLYGVYIFQEEDTVHHDLKAQNIVFDEKTSRINFIDFGLMRSKSEVKEKLKKSNYEMAIPFWYFPFEFAFLNRSKYLSFAKMNKDVVDKNEFMKLMTQQENFEKYMKMFYYNTVNNDTFITQNTADFYSTFLSTNELNYESFINKSLATIDVYGLGMAFIYVLTRSKHLLNQKFYDDMYELCMNMITASIDKRYTIDIVITKYEEILTKHKLNKDNFIFENHRIKKKTKQKPVRMIVKSLKKINISKRERTRLNNTPITKQVYKSKIHNRKTKRSPYFLKTHRNN